MRYSIHITNICNLNCTYCYEDNKLNPQRKNFIITYDEIDKRFAEIIDRKDCTEIELLGGEVFLFFDKIQYIFAKYHKYFNFLITTNGTINNQEILDLLDKYKPMISISLDDPQTTEQQRIGINFENVLNNALLWQKITMTSIGCTLNPLNIHHIKEIFDFYIIKHNFSSIHFGCVEEWMNDYYWEKYIEEGKRLINNTSPEILTRISCSPWKNFNPFKKNIIYENGIEKLEIFNNSEYEDSPYQRAKYEIHCHYCQKIGKTPIIYKKD